MTTNGSQLARFAKDLRAAGLHRVNVSLDTRDADKFRSITRRGDLSKVLSGIDAAQSVGLEIKINMVALKDVNEEEIESMLEWAHGRGMGLTLIETIASRGDRRRPRRAIFAAIDRSRQACATIHAGGKRIPHRGTGALCTRGRNRWQARLHHASHS